MDDLVPSRLVSKPLQIHDGDNVVIGIARNWHISPSETADLVGRFNAATYICKHSMGGGRLPLNLCADLTAISLPPW